MFVRMLPQKFCDGCRSVEVLEKPSEGSSDFEHRPPFGQRRLGNDGTRRPVGDWSEKLVVT
jgi:hypothetical protein